MELLIITLLITNLLSPLPLQVGIIAGILMFGSFNKGGSFGIGAIGNLMTSSLAGAKGGRHSNPFLVLLEKASP